MVVNMKKTLLIALLIPIFLIAIPTAYAQFRTESNTVTTKVGNPSSGWPVSSLSKITQGINGPFDHHALYAQGLQSIDIAPSPPGRIGDPIYASFDGTVQSICNDAQTSCGTYTGCNLNGCGYGKHVVITSTVDGKTVTVFFGHLSEISITSGQNIQQGDQIGKMGTTGFSTGVHLHWEFRGIPMSTPYVPENITPLDCDEEATPCQPASLPTQ